MSEQARPPFPPFDEAAARAKVRAAEDAWNSCDPARVVLAYTTDSAWRNRDEFPRGRAEIAEFLTRKWAREREYRLVKELFLWGADRIAVRFVYEFHDEAGQWFRAHGNENWEFADNGLMRRRMASINDRAIGESARLLRWDRSAARPAEHPGLSDLGL